MITGAFHSIPPSTVVVVIVVFIFAHYIYTSYERNKRLNRLGARPRRYKNKLPLGIDFVYKGITYARAHKNLEFWRLCFSKFGNPSNPYTLEGNAGGLRIIFTADPDNIKAVLATQFADFGKGEQFNKDWHDFLGDSIFAADGQIWHESRQLLRPQFIKDRVSDLEIFEKHTQILMPFLEGAKTVDLADLFFRYTLDAATDFLLGHSVDSLHNPTAEFSEAFAEVQRIQSLIARAGKNFKIFIPRGEFKKHIRTIDHFIDQYIDRVLMLSQDEIEKITKSEKGYTFLHALAGYTRDRTVLRDQIIAVLLAGRDTTACTLSWLFFELSNAPQCVAKLRTEIKDVVGLHRAPTYEDLKNMKYLQHCMNETLRLYPAVPFNVRMTLRDTTLPRGGGPDGSEPIGVLKDTAVGYSPLLMQRREDIYPPVASGFPPVETFVPERWDHWTPKSWTFIPFNGGPRICIGQQFALTEMGYTIVRILQRYSRVVSRMDGKAPTRRAEIILIPGGGVHVELQKDEEK